ncbi:MAG: twitching motility protein PilT [Phycisphaerae bacterium]|nr:MAG: twitching motility protein PilT [Phycisphaerae bacterium]
MNETRTNPHSLDEGFACAGGQPPAPRTISADTSTLNALLADTVRADASDLHLLGGERPRIRVHGELQPFGDAISNESVAAMLREVCPPVQRDNIDADAQKAIARLGDAFSYDLDFSFESKVDDALQRYRVNVFYAHGRLGACVRVIPGEVPSANWAGLPQEVVNRAAGFRNGLVLVTGVTGSGKSTTLAVMLQQIIKQSTSRVITIEEPIEYVHDYGDNALITQREVGVDVGSFAAGLKYGLRQDPDVILVGEIRDRETAQMALTAAETGHLVLTTIHTRDAKGAISRFTDLFPRERSDEICAQLAINLRMVLSQHLLPNAQEGQRRVLAYEVMFSNLPVTSAIRSNNLIAIGDAILTGKSDGMITLDDVLIEHLQAGRLTMETALDYATDPKRISLRMNEPAQAPKRRRPAWA